MNIVCTVVPTHMIFIAGVKIEMLTAARTSMNPSVILPIAELLTHFAVMGILPQEFCAEFYLCTWSVFKAPSNKVDILYLKTFGTVLFGHPELSKPTSIIQLWSLLGLIG